MVDSYIYLGFPVTPSGIDFVLHLRIPIESAVRRAAWIGLHSDSWGAGYRVRVYPQYLAPMFEYGAPLVYAWSRQRGTKPLFEKAVRRYPELLAWIANTKTASRNNVTINLCGLLPLLERFSQLRTAYQWTLERSGPDNPLVNAVKLLSPATPGVYRYADPDAAFTMVDFLLNTGQLREAYRVLYTVKTTLAAVYSASLYTQASNP